MNGVRKAAILLGSLDKSLAAQILALLPHDQVQTVNKAVAAAGNPPVDDLKSVLIEFKTSLHSRPVLQRNRPDPAREQLESRLRETPPAKTTPQPSNPSGGERDAYFETVNSRRTPPDVDGPFAFLTGRHADDIRELLTDEQSQTIAVVAAQLPPGLSAAVLAGLAPDRQADVLRRVARLGPTDAEILADIAAALKERIGRPRIRAGGVSQAAAVLRESPRSASRSMLSNLDNQDADLADELRQTLFAFDDLLKLDDDTLRVILQETDDRPWALALKASPEAVRQKVLGCLPAHLAKAFKAEMDTLGPIRLSEMTSVRQQIADSIRRLEDAGLIAIPMA